ncbi:MAG: SoxR reducing system RseC family protein [Thiohalocapsa sp.]|uniref:SoxR reducing system RseC family protein n=1 Tax=Thiohalocapsa sp. TaxID=2497641 RepID=UPI0025E9D2C9|nr:SoxR reducing system RseC family protein [Thiohalocapsa sp.]MCG6939779.1 SoxR reducing system RseC family protein [Thiohalocapsa sp.]
MIEEQAIVLRADAEVAYVEAIRRSACGSCHAASGCGTSLLERYFGRRSLRMELDNPLGVAAGETVVIGVPEGSMLRAAVAAYLGPLAGLILGAIAGQQWALSGAASGSDWPTLLGAAAGFLLALTLVARYGRTLAQDPRYKPVLLRREVSERVPVRVSAPVTFR